MDENWTFGVYSSLYAKGGAQDRFILRGAIPNQFMKRTVLEILYTCVGCCNCDDCMSVGGATSV
jgi:hypothetical protein